MDEQLPSGYFLQARPEGGLWRLYDIRELGECRICEINEAGGRLEINILSGSYHSALESWKTGIQEQLICTSRIIELLWQQHAPQAISDQLAAWHREEEARDFAALQNSASPTFTEADEEHDFREWMDALNGQRDDVMDLSTEELLHGDLDDFYAREEEMESQLRAEPQDDEEEDPELATEQWFDEHYTCSDELDPEDPSYQEWDDMDNFWNQEGVFEELTDLYRPDEDY